MGNHLSVEDEIVLSGYKEIFRYIAEFENKLHESHCIQFLERPERAQEQMPKLHVELLKKESGCLCFVNHIDKLKDILNDVPESKLIDIFEYHIKRYIIGEQPKSKVIVCNLVSHLQDICIEKRFTELKRTLLVKDLSGYKEIFQYFIDFENGLHKTNCITFLPLNVKEQMPNMPKLRLTLITKKDTCPCSWDFFRRVKYISDDIPESELVDSFKDGRVVQKYISETHYNDEDIVFRLVSHLQDFSIDKGFENLQRALHVTELSGYKEIFHCFVDIENGLHKTNCITFLPLSGAKEQMIDVPKLRLKLLEKKGDCKCSENFLDKVKCTLDDVEETKLVHIFKVYLQGYVRNKNNCDKDIACRLVSHLQDMCISKSLSKLARYCFRTYNSTEKLKQILTERFDDLSDKITALIISEMDSGSVSSTISSSDFHENMKTIMKDRSETLTKIMEKLVLQTDNYDDCKIFDIFERDDKCLTPDRTKFDFYYYTVYQQIAYRGMTGAVCSRAYQFLTKAKWEDWCRRVFVIDAVLYLTSIVLLTFVAVTSVNSPNVVVYQSPIDYTRAIFEIFLLLNAARILVIEIFQIIRLKKEYIVDKMNIVEISSPVMLILLLPVRYIHEQTHWYMYAVTYLVWFLQITKYAPVFKFTGVFVDSLQKMLVKDILRFGIILFFTIVVFSGTFLLVLKAENTLQLHEETTSFWKIGIVGIRIMIESDGIVEYTGDEGYKFAGAMVMMAFMFFIIVVLLNMLIAKLMNTYNKEIEKTLLNGFYVSRAKIIARLEREHMPFPFNIFKIDDKRKSFYSKITRYLYLKISDDLNISDTEKIHDDLLTTQQNLEDRLIEICNTLQELKKYCVSLRDSVNHLEPQMMPQKPPPVWNTVRD